MCESYSGPTKSGPIKQLILLSGVDCIILNFYSFTLSIFDSKHLINVNFLNIKVHFDKGESEDVSRVTNMNSVTPVANLLGLRMDELMPALVSKCTATKGDSAKVKFGKDQAYLARYYTEKCF